jgi:hypothetical protein
MIAINLNVFPHQLVHGKKAVPICPQHQQNSHWQNRSLIAFSIKIHLDSKDRIGQLGLQRHNNHVWIISREMVLSKL